MYTYLFSADVSQMYRQIKLAEQDMPLIRIFWRDNLTEPLRIYEFTTLPFGLSCSPFIATRCLKLLAETAGEEFSRGKEALLMDCYVDNIFSGADSFGETLDTMKQLTLLLKSGGFPLKKWCSNNLELLAGIPPENLEKKFPLYFGLEMVIKTLGMIWDPNNDVFKIWVHMRESTLYTKREILSIIASIFDPFGVLAPFTIRANIWMQNLWKLHVKWDERLSEDLIKQWLEFSHEFAHLERISIPRHIKNGKPEYIEIHGFSDASEKAYGGAIYIRTIENDNVTCRLLCAKTRVAPLKQVSVARLELCGALTLVELLARVKTALSHKWKFNLIRLWCDSQVSLCWIKSNHSRWLPFIANRVLMIQQKQGDAIWDYVKTDENPADLLSRGLKSDQLENNALWWQGPEFLLNNANPYHKDVKFQPSRVQPLEMRQSRKILTFSLSFKDSLISRFSNYTKLLRITAWVQRFIWNLHYIGPFLTGPIQLFELNQALTTLIKLVQKEKFHHEVRKLDQGENVEKASSLASLNPFLDAQNVIRVGGRLSQSNLSFDQKFPIVLPHDHTFTKLLIRYEHEKNFHSSIQAMRSILRRNYWILRQDSAIQHCILNCVKCIRIKADTRVQMMASLPKARVVPAKVFDTTGIDYAGPLKLLVRRGKGSKNIESKAYIAVFVCFATKAIHLELVSDLTTEAFLAAFDRFIGRRGLPSNVWSDNGTNFVGANKKLQELFNFFKNNESFLCSNLLMKGCSWHFIPPHSPSFGGLWEAGVKSVKTHLIKSIGETLFTYEQYETLLIKIEACLNSRPLFLESSDPNDINAITPGHFLIGGPLTAIPNSDISEVPINRLKYWQQTTKKMQEFWNRWSKEYLNRLQQRNKWRQNKCEIKIGDIVIVKEDNCPPLQWPLAKIVDVHPGNDNIVRVVTLKMRTGEYANLKEKLHVRFGTFKRPVSKLVYLPDPTQPHT